jgi:hypothetical protein
MPEMSGPAHSCTDPTPREAANARNARCAARRCAAVIPACAARRTTWWASRLSGPSAEYPADRTARAANAEDTNAEDTRAECASILDR